MKDILLLTEETSLLNGQMLDTTVTVLPKSKTTLQILNGAQMRETEKFFRTDKHQLLFTHFQISTARTPTMLTSISQLQLEILLHRFPSRFGLKQVVQLRRDQLVHHLQVLNGAQTPKVIEKFSLTEEQLLSHTQTLDSTAKIPNMKDNNQ